MYYLIFECDTEHQGSTPKDQTKVTRIHYQLVHADELKPLLEPSGLLEVGKESLQSIVYRLEANINDRVGGLKLVLCSLYSTWHLRVTLPRQSYDENWVLPSFLQHVKVFDLWKEYDRWTSNHPQAVAVGTNKNKGNDSAEIFAALELNELNLSKKDHLEQAVRVLLTLHKKCSTAEDQCMVLTHPYDSYADTLGFIQEHSKVLYMNNLPPDTTQSELESWFTQFCFRPVGFWTVKNVVEDTSNVKNNWSTNNSRYVEENDSISGFVVFQSHKEANEALFLNGRSILSNMANTKQPKIIEHVVEIKPSSTRVLDFAQDILSLFPQSKNKPRPGDWNCPSCGFSNFQRRITCFRCSFCTTNTVSVNNVYNFGHRSHYQNNNQQKQQQQQQVNTQQSRNSHHQQHIQVQRSTMHYQQQPVMGIKAQGEISHFKSRSQAGLQSHNKMYQQQQYPLQHQPSQQFIINPEHNVSETQRRYNRYTRMGNQTGNNNNNNINNGSNVPFRAGDWKCLNCFYHNFAKNIVCLRCGNSKAVSNDESLSSITSSCSNYTILSSSVHRSDNSTNISMDTASATKPIQKQSTNGIKTNNEAVSSNNEADYQDSIFKQ